MASLVVRNIDDDVKERLRVRAAENGRSMEAEAREILEAAVAPGRPPERNWLQVWHDEAQKLGGFELDIPPRDVDDVREGVDFSGPEWDVPAADDEP